MSDAKQATDVYGRPLYRVTREFTSGVAIGQTFTETTAVRRNVGQVVPAFFGPGYRILACEPLQQKDS